MTGPSPARFRAQPGTADWRVTSRGAEAVFRADSIASAAGLVPVIVELAEAADLAPDLDVRPEALIVRVLFDEDALPEAVTGFAVELSARAREAGLVADPDAVQAVDIFVAEHEDAETRSFWGAVLGYVERGELDTVDPLRRGPMLAVNPIGNGKRGRGRTHIDLFVSESVARARVEAALAAGGRLVDDSQAPAFWTVASPDNHGVDIAAWVDNWEGP